MNPCSSHRGTNDNPPASGKAVVADVPPFDRRVARV
jgi:hypothetical protein